MAKLFTTDFWKHCTLQDFMLAPIWDRLRVMQLLQMSWSVNLLTSFYNYVGYGHYRVLVDSKIEELSGGRRRVEEEIVNMVVPGVHI